MPASEPPAPRAGWLGGLPREVPALASIAFCVALGFGIVAPALPVYARTFGVGAFAASAVVSAFALMRLVSAPGAGALVGRVGERTVLATGLAVVAVSSALAGLAGSYAQLLVLRGVGGVGSAMFTVSALGLLLRSVPADARGRAAGVFQGGFLFGGIAGPAVGGAVVAWSIRAPFFVYAGTLLLAVVVTLVVLREHVPGAPDAPGPAAPAHAAEPGEELPAPADGGPAAPADGPPGPPASPTLRRALRLPAYRAALAVNLANGFVGFGLRSALVPLFVTDVLHQSASLTGVGFLVAAAVQGALLLPAGRTADTRGRRPAMLAGSAATVAGMALLAVGAGVPLFLASMAVLGAGAAFLGSAPAAVVGDVSGGHGRGALVAAFQMTADAGTIAGPLIAGALADSAGYGWAFGLGAAVAAGALATVVAMPETRGR